MGKVKKGGNDQQDNGNEAGTSTENDKELSNEEKEYEESIENIVVKKQAGAKRKKKLKSNVDKRLKTSIKSKLKIKLEPRSKVNYKRDNRAISKSRYHKKKALLQEQNIDSGTENQNMTIDREDEMLDCTLVEIIPSSQIIPSEIVVSSKIVPSEIVVSSEIIPSEIIPSSGIIVSSDNIPSETIPSSGIIVSPEIIPSSEIIASEIILSEFIPSKIIVPPEIIPSEIITPSFKNPNIDTGTELIHENQEEMEVVDKGEVINNSSVIKTDLSLENEKLNEISASVNEVQSDLRNIKTDEIIEYIKTKSHLMNETSTLLNNNQNETENTETRMIDENIATSHVNDGLSDSAKVDRDEKNRKIIEESILSKKGKFKAIKKSEHSLKSIVKKKSKLTGNKKSKKAASTNIQYTVNELDEITCKSCHQNINNELTYHSGEPSHGLEEGVAILDSRLLLFSGNEETYSKEDTRAYNKLTSFSVYCENGHLCPFDSGLIEKDLKIYFSGYVKPIFSDDPSIENGAVPGKKFGPIVEWWTTGFDVGEEPTVAFSTEIGDYVLMQPSEEYKPFMQLVMNKILISKVVIEFLIYEPNASYEDLLCKLQNTHISGNTQIFTEDMLMHYAPFICVQVMSFDEVAEPGEPLLAVAPCIRRIVDLAGIELTPKDSYIQSRKQSYRYFREELLRKLAVETPNNSTMDKLFEKILPHNIDGALIKSSKDFRSNRCGKCDRCQRQACGECTACKRMKDDFCSRRRCFFYEIQEANEEDVMDLANAPISEIKNSFDAYCEKLKVVSCSSSNLSWLSEPILQKSNNTYYAAIKVNDEIIEPGDFVSVYSIDPSVIAQVFKVAYLWEDETGAPFFHANYFWWGKDTILGDIADPKELFFIGRCCNIPVTSIRTRVKVNEIPILKDWKKSDASYSDLKKEFFCQKFYEPMTGCFEDLPVLHPCTIDQIFCQNCERVAIQSKKNAPQVIDKLEEYEDRVTYDAVLFRDEKYRAGNTVYLKPRALYFNYPMLNIHTKSHGYTPRTIDEEKYPELYRKSVDLRTDLKFDAIEPFGIGYITEISTMNDNVFIKVKKFYRPENTHKGESFIRQADFNLLFWSDEVFTVAFKFVVGKCYVVHAKNLNSRTDEWSIMGPDRFYFSQSYKDREFSSVDRKDYGCPDLTRENPKDYPKIRKLKTLNIFGGCGGLSLGLRQSGLTTNNWTIEGDEGAASTYKLNSPDTIVYTEDCDSVLRKLLNGEVTVPLKGDVDLLTATLPYENYRLIDHISAYKKSKIATFVAYCDYYKPDYLILEADERFIKRSAVLKLTMASLISMGYQITFDLMQVSCYGAPQNRKRSVLLGAVPGKMLPKFPKPLHVAYKTLYDLAIVVDNKKYFRSSDWTESAPHRLVTVQDAIMDLINVEMGRNNEVVNYNCIPIFHYQKKMRLGMLESTLFDHTCKDLDPLVQARIMQIPKAVGSDWRNLPNIEVQMRDGSFTKKLVYKYDDKEAGYSSNGAFRGVCRCSIGKSCDPCDIQEKTLIPWHLVHSSKRHRHWPGLYGRLQWNGCFVGSNTNPEPLGNQGPVIHPTQTRLMSIRELARSQGFPDDFILAQNISVYEKYRLIGSSTSPLLAFAIGREIVKSLDSKN